LSGLPERSDVGSKLLVEKLLDLVGRVFYHARVFCKFRFVGFVMRPSCVDESGEFESRSFDGAEQVFVLDGKFTSIGSRLFDDWRLPNWCIILALVERRAGYQLESPH
jgi:hypothetical protein